MQLNKFDNIDAFVEYLTPGKTIPLKDGRTITVVSKPVISGGDYIFKGFIYENDVKMFDLTTLWNYKRIRFDDSENEEVFELNKDSNKEKITNHKLFEIMDGACRDGSSKYFYHFTYYGNAVNIIKSGFFYSRYYLESNKIPVKYDNKKVNFTSASVMNNNKSVSTETFVRFYLRLDNSAIRNQRVTAFNMGYLDVTCVFLINRNALALSETKTYLSRSNAHYNDNRFFETHCPCNCGLDCEYPFDLLEHDFEKVYGQYDDSAYGKMFQCAEFLVQEKLPIKYIEKIYFMSEKGIAKFLASIRDLSCYNDIKRKCAVKPEYFCKHD